MFVANTHGKGIVSVLPLLNLLEILTVYNVHSLHTLKFTQRWHKGLLPNVFCDIFRHASDVHSYNARYATQQNLCKSRVRTILASR